MNFILFKTYSFYTEANIALGLLQNNGINCYLKDELINTLDHRMSIGSGGIKLYIEANLAEAASKLMVEVEETYLRTLNCENCGAQEIALDESIIMPKGFFDALKNKLLYGSSKVHKKEYRCLTCGELYENR